jgi:hypothetical protein
LTRAELPVLADDVLVLPELAALLPDDPQADNPTATVPASAQAAKARRPRVKKGGQADCIRMTPQGKVLVEAVVAPSMSARRKR